MFSTNAFKFFSSAAERRAISRRANFSVVHQLRKVNLYTELNSYGMFLNLEGAFQIDNLWTNFEESVAIIFATKCIKATNTIHCYKYRNFSLESYELYAF